MGDFVFKNIFFIHIEVVGLQNKIYDKINEMMKIYLYMTKG